MTIADILSLPGWLVQEVAEVESHLVIEASLLEAPLACPSCGSTRLPYHFGRRDRQFFDLPIRLRPVLIHAVRHRYRCKDCGATYQDTLPDIDERYEATERLIRYLEVQALDPTQTFTKVKWDQ